MESNVFWDFMIILSTTIELIVYKCIISEFSESKGNRFRLNSMIIGAIIIISVLTKIGFDPNIKLAIGMFLTIAIYICNYKDKLSKMIMVCAIYWMVLLGIDAVTMSFVTWINNIDTYKILMNTTYRLETIIVSKGVLISFVSLIKSMKVKINLRLREFILIIIPIITNVLSIVMIYSFQFGLMDGYEFKDIAMIIFTSLIAISNISLMFVIIRLIREVELKSENEMIRQKIESQYKHYVELQNAQLKVRKLYHDMNNHLVCIENMQNRNESPKEYIDSMKKELNKWSSIKTTGNMIVDIILNEKKEICEKNNIDFLADVNFFQCDFIDMMDMCSIFSNILDNAIEANLKIKDDSNKKIRLVGNIVNKFFVMKCENSKSNDIIKKENKIFTDKKDKYLHGLGINSVKNSLEKYDGKLAVDYTEDNFVINIYIPLKGGL